MAVDLHLHSRASDGTESPSRVVELAATAGLKAIALTDHDTLAGIPEAVDAAKGLGIELIPGAELSLEYDGGLHLLCLWLEPGDGPLQDRLEELRSGRDIRNSEILEILRGHGIDISDEELAAESGGGAVGRPHIAALLQAKGHVPDIATAFDVWLGRGRLAYAPRRRLQPAEGIRLARESGAVPILAHPHTLGINRAEDMARLLHELREYGLVGLESHYAGYHRHEREGYTDLARRFGLTPSGGSDYHGAYKPGLAIGSGYGDLHVPDTVLEELREYAGK